MTSVSLGASFAHDADGARIKKSEGGQTTIYVNKYYEKNVTTGEVTSYYYLGNKMVAYKKGSTVEYVSQDHLGSTSVTTSAAGATVATMKYYPFGGARSSTGVLGTDMKFMGQRLDDTGFYYYGARMYDPEIGRLVPSLGWV